MKKLSLLLPFLILSACSDSSSNGGPGGNDNGGNTSTSIHYFSASNGVNGLQIWKTDGTEAGTEMVKVINASGDANVKVMTSLNDKVIFTAKDGINGQELWITDGTDNGTVMLKDINPGAANTSIQTSAVAGGNLYLSIYNAANGTELWKTDGTAQGTVLVKDINPGATGSGVDSLVALGNEVYFRANDGVNGYRIWKSDGTEAGTVDIGASVPPDELIVSEGVIYFRGYDAANGTELWKSDGTAQGTQMIKDISPGATSSIPTNFVSMGGNIYFLASENSAQGVELWRSDGTDTGTTLVKNINPETTGNSNNNSSHIQSLSATDDKLFFIARPSSATSLRELWVSDGTDAGTISLHNAGSVSDIIVTQNGTYFDGYDAINGGELWKTDGTLAGTALLKDAVPGTGSSGFYSLGVFQYYETPWSPVLELSDGSILMAGYTPENGSEVWKTDGTEAGTVLIKDINPGAGSALDD